MAKSASFGVFVNSYPKGCKISAIRSNQNVHLTAISFNVEFFAIAFIYFVPKCGRNKLFTKNTFDAFCLIL